ncbi:MAG: hypothetical protein NUV59_02120 [Patescibacteria group bacterium]|nr:hypothetical protein [Patescibacteria group bacterium]
MTIAMVFFLLALVGVITLFSLKYWEIRSGRVVMPEMRTRIDESARYLKGLMLAARVDLAKLSPQVLRIARLLVHEAALLLAALARAGERQAHRLADMVSYKHRFEARKTRSEFLKKVSENKDEEE